MQSLQKTRHEKVLAWDPLRVGSEITRTILVSMYNASYIDAGNGETSLPGFPRQLCPKCTQSQFVFSRNGWRGALAMRRI